VTKVAQAETGLPSIKNPFDSLQISIPGMKRFNDAQKCSDDPSKLCVGWIGEYIAGIYNYAIGVVGILATITMMIGGVIWLTAGGNSSRIGEAQAWITSSVTGLLIALTSYMILYQINPDILKVFDGSLRIQFVEKVPDKEPLSTEGNPNNSQDCNNCVTLASGRYKDGNMINSDIAAKLNTVNTNGINWIVSEAYPPASQHQSKCHYNGMCADIGIRSDATCENVTKLIAGFNGAGFKVLNEFQGCGGIGTTYATGGHLHISL